MKVVNVATKKPEAQVSTAETEHSPQYPWGTEMHLDHDTMSALEAANGPLPDVGKNVHVVAHGTVTSKGADKMADGSVRKSARIQLTDIGHEDPAAEGKGAKGMYPSADDSGE